MDPLIAWALENPPNPAVLRLHTRRELTTRTIETLPPRSPEPPFDALLEIDGVRSVDLHRYRARLNLAPGTDKGTVETSAAEVLRAAWGEPESLGPDAAPLAFPASNAAPRRVAESLEMAGDHALLSALFRLDGVAEAILGECLLLVRPGRLFPPEEIVPAVWVALGTAGSD